MKIERIPYDSGMLVTFFEEALTGLGALCERTWHDRLQVVADGAASRLWNESGTLHEAELVFIAPDVTTARDARTEVFPGCPLTFRLAEQLRPAPLPLERAVIAAVANDHPPDAAVSEKLWRAQYPGTTKWRLTAAFKRDYHFSLVALCRCEIQAIDQHWSLRRLALALPSGESDVSLAQNFGFASLDPSPPAVSWPELEPSQWQAYLNAALEAELGPELNDIRLRQEAYLRRELERIDAYFTNYQEELTSRATRSASAATKMKSAERLTAAKAEHARRRSDQVARHEIRICPHFEALLLIAEPAWRAPVETQSGRDVIVSDARFLARARRWFKL